ncbi:MAG TPA: hypothetical protein VF556_05985 [Pyrinomonadaceae bacterium]|jgi:hypothetical protein
MRKLDEMTRRETDLAVALATFLLNVLIILILCVCGWMLHTVVLQPNSYGVFLSESILR